MSYDDLRYEVDGGVAEITLDQPERHNPLGEMASQLVDALERAQASEEVTVVLLTGAGESFSAGGDIEQFAQRMEEPATEIHEDGRTTSVRLFTLLASYEKPLVGAINGSAFGGGTGLVAACHVAYAAEGARFGTTEITLGLFPMVILPALRTTLGDAKTLELALTARRIPAAEAREIGLVTEVFPDEDVLERARTTAREIAQYSPYALRLGLQSFHETTGMDAATAIEVLNTYRVLFYKSHDLKEGAEAFLEDREPVWEGR